MDCMEVAFKLWRVFENHRAIRTIDKICDKLGAIKTANLSFEINTLHRNDD